MSMYEVTGTELKYGYIDLSASKWCPMFLVGGSLRFKHNALFLTCTID